MVVEREYWVYKPWTLYIVKSHERSRKTVRDCRLDVTLYDDRIEGQTHSKTVEFSGFSRFNELFEAVLGFVCGALRIEDATMANTDDLRDALLDVFAD